MAYPPTMCCPLDQPEMAFFLECVEKLCKRNELAAGSFVALGQTIDLAGVKNPIFLLAARDDEFVAPPQVLAAERLVRTPAPDVGKAIAACRHLGLFAGKRTLEDFWPKIVRWLGAVPRSHTEIPAHSGSGTSIKTQAAGGVFQRAFAACRLDLRQRDGAMFRLSEAFYLWLAVRA